MERLGIAWDVVHTPQGTGRKRGATTVRQS
jgi:hypothetical protein